MMLDERFTGGGHETLRVLHDAELPPFDDAYG